VQLEHGADLDLLVAQVIGLGHHVDDVDARDRPVNDRLTLGERDLHSIAFELGPVVVRAGLGEAQLARVERPGRVEIGDPVPDARHNARPGSSSSVFSSRRNSAALRRRRPGGRR
jgi:hypothetical protein